MEESNSLNFFFVIDSWFVLTEMMTMKTTARLLLTSRCFFFFLFVGWCCKRWALYYHIGSVKRENPNYMSQRRESTGKSGRQPWSIFLFHITICTISKSIIIWGSKTILKFIIKNKKKIFEHLEKNLDSIKRKYKLNIQNLKYIYIFPGNTKFI